MSIIKRGRKIIKYILVLDPAAVVGRELYYYYHYMQNFALYSLQSLVVAYQNLSYLTEAD